jgi:hypothetical protein
MVVVKVKLLVDVTQLTQLVSLKVVPVVVIRQVTQ